MKHFLIYIFIFNNLHCFKVYTRKFTSKDTKVFKNILKSSIICNVNKDSEVYIIKELEDDYFIKIKQKYGFISKKDICDMNYKGIGLISFKSECPIFADKELKHMISKADIFKTYIVKEIIQENFFLTIHGFYIQAPNDSYTLKRYP